MYVSAITTFLLKAGLFELLKAIEISKYVIFFIFIYKKIYVIIFICNLQQVYYKAEVICQVYM